MLYLASGSPRRRSLLRRAGYRFRVVVPEKEPDLRFAEPEEIAKEKACFKARYVLNQVKRATVLAADTLVVLGDKVFGKPKDLKEAKEFLKELQGKVHRVITGLCVTNGEREVKKAEITLVKVSRMSEQEIFWILERDRPFDKAGAYAIQGAMAIFIERIEGDYTNVVGLPLPLVYRLLGEFGVYPYKMKG